MVLRKLAGACTLDLASSVTLSFSGKRRSGTETPEPLPKVEGIERFTIRRMGGTPRDGEPGQVSTPGVPHGERRSDPQQAGRFPESRSIEPRGPDRGAFEDRVLTVPNALSFLRIVLIPVFVVLLLHRSTRTAGLLVLSAVVATDWIDGYIARRTGQVSTLGKVLDPLADRLALGAGLIALVIADAFPLWAALVVLIRDGLILVASALVLLAVRIRLEVRRVGKIATLCLMTGIPAVAWSSFGLPLEFPSRVVGWILYGVGAVLYYVAAAYYVSDLRSALRDSPGGSEHAGGGGRESAGPPR